MNSNVAIKRVVLEYDVTSSAALQIYGALARVIVSQDVVVVRGVEVIKQMYKVVESLRLVLPEFVIGTLRASQSLICITCKKRESRVNQGSIEFLAVAENGRWNENHIFAYSIVDEFHTTFKVRNRADYPLGLRK